MGNKVITNSFEGTTSIQPIPTKLANKCNKQFFYYYYTQNRANNWDCMLPLVDHCGVCTNANETKDNSVLSMAVHCKENKKN